MTYHSISVVVVVFSALMYTCIAEPCPGNHRCNGIGYEVINIKTGEKGFCTAINAHPICSGYSDTTSTTTTTTDTPTTTTTTHAVICEVASCTNKKPGVYAYPDCKCEKYYSCTASTSRSSSLVLRQYRCTGRKVFNKATYTCVINTFVCPYAQG
ncbi:uncharacterized protein [Cherax quadricarinatus]|uniref:uncharacterized protein n=1 Tax=Cherax quadricarinatus TaxID=27406 RepID=UPI00387E6ED5